MIMHVRYCLVMVTLFLSSCSKLSFLEVNSKEVDPIESVSGSSPERIPFILEVLSENNDGKRLTVKGRIIPKTKWDSSQLIVRLSAVDQSGKQHQIHFPMTELDQNNLKNDLESMTPSQFELEISSEEISNYQLELLWGNDATAYTNKQMDKTAPKKSEFLALRNLEVHRVPGDECAFPDECKVKFTISGEFFNSGSAEISRIVIRTGFIRGDFSDLDQKVFEDERQIEIRNLKLQAGASKKFRFSLDKKVLSTESLAPRPVVRIVTFDTEKLYSVQSSK